MKRAQKGIVFSIDALIAFTLMFTILLVTASYLSGVTYEARNSLVLKENALDIVTVLEKNGEFENAVQTNKVTGLRSYINKLPSSVCSNIEVFEESDLTNATMSVLRPGCQQNFSDSATINRSFIVQNNTDANFYIGRATVWWRVN